MAFQDVGGEGRVHVRNLAHGRRQGRLPGAVGRRELRRASRARAYIAAPEGFLWARTNMGSGRGNRLVRYTLRGSKLAYAPGSPHYISTGWAGATLGAVTTSAIGGSESAQRRARRVQQRRRRVLHASC